MIGKLLWEEFDRVAEAPDAIEQLRRFVLDLAVRGKLVEQRPEEGTAKELLERLKDAAAVSKYRRASRANGRSSDVAAPFPIPHTWEWCTVANVGAIVGGGTPPTSDPLNFAPSGTGIAWVTPADLGSHAGPIISHGARDLSAIGMSKCAATVMPKGTVLFSSRAPIGYVAISSGPITTNQGFRSVVPYLNGMSQYIALFLRAFRETIEAKASGTTFREVSGKVMTTLPFPLPPLDEQERITTKVAELMRLCDSLESARSSRESIRDTLRAACLRRVRSNAGGGMAGDDETLDIVTNHYEKLITDPNHVGDLREMIRDLAVQGRLWRDPENRVDISNWESTNIRELTSIVTSGSRGWSDYYASSGAKFIRAQNVRFGRLLLDKLAFVDIPPQAEGSRTRLDRHDIVVVITGAGVTNPALVDLDLGEAYVSQHIGLIKLKNKEFAPWVLLCLMAPASARGQLMARAYGAGKPGLNLTNIRTLDIPLPSLPEQRRILERVNQLMGVCDALERDLRSARNSRLLLLRSLLRRALDAPR
ncbi:restriction endonuclease subunit S [Nonomuraea wenchangensis]|uniref:restriction endonuclease subunit S n=1 Tax=Nonomuraea wenchangensis TaxID=568860 RepID=UPI0037B184D2